MGGVSGRVRAGLSGPVRRVGRAVTSAPVKVREAARTERLTLYRFPVPPPEELARMRVDGPAVELTPADDELIDRMKAQHPKLLNDRKERILRSRIGSMAEQCLVLSQGDDIVGYCHIARGDNLNERINHLVRLGPHEVYLFDTHVFKPFRGGGLHRASILARLERVAGEGMAGVVTVISDGNEPSIRSFRRLGAEPTARLVHIPRLGRTVERRIRRRPGVTQEEEL